MELDTIGDRKTALFVIISDTDDTFNFVVSILYTQLFNLLCDKADDEYGGRLPVHVRCLLDEFANIGQIPKFEKLIATIRSREISASIILQSQSQLKAIYKDNADTIVGNCDTTLILSLSLLKKESSDKKVAIKNGDKGTKTATQKIAILEYLTDHASAKCSDISDMLGVKDARARRILSEMIVEGTIVTEGGNRNRIYKLKS